MMARPGLEPGTPRFSGTGSGRTEGRGLQALRRTRVRARCRWIPAVSRGFRPRAQCPWPKPRRVGRGRRRREIPSAGRSRRGVLLRDVRGRAWRSRQGRARGPGARCGCAGRDGPEARSSLVPAACPSLCRATAGVARRAASEEPRIASSAGVVHGVRHLASRSGFEDRARRELTEWGCISERELSEAPQFERGTP